MGKRLRDPIHGLIVFDEEDPLEVDDLAWRLIDTPEFQRLRRIRQLGVSEYTFPGAVHSRFSHSIGVFNTARVLVKVIERESKRNGQLFDRERARVALVSALLHDLGHGPFSHTFESVQTSRGVKKRHERWTAEIIRNQNGRIFSLLEASRTGFSEDVATLLGKDDPEDIYHAVVSSSFDADRLDYLRRDRQMTGTGAGAIDFEWLVENLRVANIEIDTPDESGPSSRSVQSFCFEKKALPAAEQFLLSRYTLHQQVYFHKATRCAEKMIGKLLRAVSRASSGDASATKLTALPDSHPLIRFYRPGGENIENYLALDDSLILGALFDLSSASDPIISDTAARLRERRLYKSLDLNEFGEDGGNQRSALRKIRAEFGKMIDAEDILLDDGASVGIYSEIGGDDDLMHKKVHILERGQPTEISKLSPLITALSTKRQFTRLYFAESSDRDRARFLGGGYGKKS